MDTNNFDDLLAQGRQVADAVAKAYKEATGEDLDLESSIRHYPLTALGLAAGIGALAGWWIGHRGAPSLPAPPIETIPKEPAPGIVERVEHALPDTVARLRDALPEITVSDEVKERVLSWAGTVLEKQFQQNVDNLADTLDARLSGFFRRGLQRYDTQPDVKLEDPESSPPSNGPSK